MKTTITRILAVGSALGLLALVPQTAALAGTDDRPAVTAKVELAESATTAISCNDTESDKDGSSWRASAEEPANMRSGPSTDCAINGVLQTSDRADYHCWKPGEVNGQYATFTYLRDDRTGAYGWVWDNLLDDHGSRVRC
jgi:hypothetical protein